MKVEDQKFREYLEAHGWNTSQMGLGDVDSIASTTEDDKDVKIHEKEVNDERSPV